MKYIIFESKLRDLVFSNLNSIPEYNDVKIIEDNFFDYDQGVSVDVVYFEYEPNFPSMTYYPIQSDTTDWNEVDLESQPLLMVHFPFMMKRYVGENLDKYFMEWFEQKFNLPVKSIYFEYE